MTVNPATIPPKMTRIERLMRALDDDIDFLDNEPTRPMARQLILDLLGMSDLPLGERIAQRALASISAEHPSEGTVEELRNLVFFTERWLPDALPADDNGQVHFARALTESLVAGVKAHLAKEHGDADAAAGR